MGTPLGTPTPRTRGGPFRRNGRRLFPLRIDTWKIGKRWMGAWVDLHLSCEKKESRRKRCPTFPSSEGSRSKKTWPQQSSIPCRLERFSSAIRPQANERVSEATHKFFSHISISFASQSSFNPLSFFSSSYVSSLWHHGMKRIAKESVWSFFLGGWGRSRDCTWEDVQRGS